MAIAARKLLADTSSNIASNTARPILQVRDQGELSVLWRSEDGEIPTLEWKSGSSWETSNAVSARQIDGYTAGGSSVRQFRFALKGAASSDPLTYRLRLGNGWTPATNQIAGIAPDKVPGRVVFWGDSGTLGTAQSAVFAQMMNANPSMGIHTGDTAYPAATPSSLRELYFEPYGSMMERIPVLACLGNHDCAYDDGAALNVLQDLPKDRGYFNVRLGPAEFFILDTNTVWNLAASKPMLEWLENTLKASKAFFKIAVFHHTPYPTEFHSADLGCVNCRENVIPILRKYGVTLTVSGHEHLYSRTDAAKDDGYVHVTTGGGGGSLYNFIETAPANVGRSVYHFVQMDWEPWGVTLKAVDWEGREFDSVSVRPRPRLTGIRRTPQGGYLYQGYNFTPASLQSESGAELLGGVAVWAESARMKIVRVSPTELETAPVEGAPKQGYFELHSRNGACDGTFVLPA